MKMKKKKAKNCTDTHTPSTHTHTQRHTQRQTHEHRSPGSRAVGRESHARREIFLLILCLILSLLSSFCR